MQMLVMIIIVVASTFVSFKMAEEKLQNKFIWAAFTCFLGPLVIIIQYLAAYFNNKKPIQI